MYLCSFNPSIFNQYPRGHTRGTWLTNEFMGDLFDWIIWSETGTMQREVCWVLALSKLWKWFFGKLVDTIWSPNGGPLFLKVNPPKQGHFQWKTRVIWVPGRYRFYGDSESQPTINILGTVENGTHPHPFGTPWRVQVCICVHLFNCI